MYIYIYIYTNPEEHLTWLCGVKTPCSEEERTLARCSPSPSPSFMYSRSAVLNRYHIIQTLHETRHIYRSVGARGVSGAAVLWQSQIDRVWVRYHM